ncbi:GGDEF domain-containing protein [Nitrincola tibetensis]|uniref:GGDEF domain-containing protein n=2 Tax=Nitrincola tibetensis TaxID=2219697 RepID=A0A364NRV1_9GAMM|nr:GGDEF domain-containing protein [Nitrincola tibetensis]
MVPVLKNSDLFRSTYSLVYTRFLGNPMHFNLWKITSRFLRNPFIAVVLLIAFNACQLHASADFASSVLNRHSAPMLLIDPENGQIVDANQSASNFYGYSLDTIKNYTIQDLNVLDDDAIRQEIARAASEQRNYFVFYHRLSDQSIRAVEVYSSPVDLESKTYLLSIVLDVTEKSIPERVFTDHKETLERLVQERTEQLETSQSVQKSIIWLALFFQSLVILGLYLSIRRRQDAENQLQKLTMAVEQSPDSIVITDLKGNIEYVNSAFEEKSGYTFRETVGQNPRFLHSGKTDTHIYKDMWETLIDGRIWRGEFVNQRKNGTEYTELATIAPVRDKAGVVINYLAIKRDITEQKMADEKIYQLAFFDSLTGLANRSLLFERLSQALTSTARLQHQEALLLINIDRFKMINDAHGIGFGDELLKVVSLRLVNLLRVGDTIARTAGDEFAVMLPDINQQAGRASRHALVVAEKIHAALRATFDVQGEAFTITVSIGITTFPDDQDTLSGTVFRRAETALHRAKSSGGNQTAFFETSMGEAASSSFRTEQELRSGIQNNELCLYLQPQFNYKHQIEAAEVLVRWQHPSRGLLYPGAFIPIAEESDLIVDLGKWVFKESCRLMVSEYSNGRGLPLSINISPKHFTKSNFVEWIDHIVNETGVDPNWVVLEITENLFIKDFDTVVVNMQALVERGFRFSIDDFGTGYSSLVYLKRLPIHELKIDKTFVQEAPFNRSDAVLVETLLSVAKHMNLKVVAEGVETQAQADFLQSRADILYQGYLFGRPEPAAYWIEKWRT